VVSLENIKKRAKNEGVRIRRWQKEKAEQKKRRRSEEMSPEFVLQSPNLFSTIAEAK